MVKEAIAKSPSGRVRRTPVGVRNVLTVNGKDPAYEYRVVNDKDDRVQQYMDAGYEIVKASDIRVGDSRVNAPSAEGSIATCSVGGGMKGVVMRIRKEWYEEDQAAKMAQIDQLEAATKAEPLEDGNYGNVNLHR